MKRASKTEKAGVRLNKFIALCGVASRRQADDLIRDGLVRVNGKTITELGQFVHPQRDTVVVKGKPVRPVQDKVYVVFNKPSRVVTSMNEATDRPSIKDYFTKARIRLFPVDKLDWDAEGMVLLTNDGEFAQRVSHSKNKTPQTYLVKLSGHPSDEQLRKLVRGFSILGGRIHVHTARRMNAPNRKKRRTGSPSSEKYDWIKIIISEEKNERIRLMFHKLGFDVKKLRRIAIGSLKLANLDKGKFKILEADDIRKIFQIPKELKNDHSKAL